MCQQCDPPYDYPHDFPVSEYQHLVGKTIAVVEQNPTTDEGLRITFTDKTRFSFGFSGCEGSIIKR